MFGRVRRTDAVTASPCTTLQRSIRCSDASRQPLMSRIHILCESLAENAAPAVPAPRTRLVQTWRGSVTGPGPQRLSRMQSDRIRHQLSPCRLPVRRHFSGPSRRPFRSPLLPFPPPAAALPSLCPLSPRGLTELEISTEMVRERRRRCLRGLISWSTPSSTSSSCRRRSPRLHCPSLACMAPMGGVRGSEVAGRAFAAGLTIEYCSGPGAEHALRN
jgi:hypothetical protein